MRFRDVIFVLTGCALHLLASRPEARCPTGSYRVGDYCLREDSYVDLDAGDATPGLDAHEAGAAPEPGAGGRGGDGGAIGPRETLTNRNLRRRPRYDVS